MTDPTQHPGGPYYAPQQFDPAQQYPVPQQYAPTQQFATRSLVPPSNVGWAVAALIFFWPLAFSAFTHALNVFPKWSLGDFGGAQHASDRAKKLGQISLLIFVVGMFLLIVFYVVMIVAVVNGIDDGSYSSTW